MDTLASDAKPTLEHNVTIEYEGLYMGQGKVTRFNPSGWTDLHYDLDPSPLGGIFGRFSGGLYGPNGLIADGTSLFQDLQDMKDNPNADARGGLDVILRGVRLINNANNLNQDVVNAEVRNATINSIGFGLVNGVTGAVQGLSVPRPTFSEFYTEATSRSNVSPRAVNVQIAPLEQNRVTISTSNIATNVNLNNTAIVNNAIDALQRNQNTYLVETYNNLSGSQKNELYNLAAKAVTQIYESESNPDVVSSAAARLLIGGGTVSYYVESNANTLSTTDESDSIVRTVLTSLLTNLELKKVYDKMPESLIVAINKNASKAANQVLVDNGTLEDANVAAKTLWTFEIAKFAVNNFESINGLF